MIKLVPIVVDEDYPLWEFTYDIADDIHAEMYVESNWISQAQNEIRENAGRWCLDPSLSLYSRLTGELGVIQYEITKQIFDSNDYFAKATHTRWPRGVSVRDSTQIIKDYPSFNMWPHIDNRNAFAPIVLNLADNPCSTQFYLDGKLIHTGPTQRGTGIVFLNTEKAYHAIDNQSDQPRYISFMNITLQMESTYRFN